MNKTAKLTEMEKVWGSHPRDITWTDIDWDTGRYGETTLQKQFASELIDKLATQSAKLYIWGPEDASGWLEWEYVLASWLYAWYQLPVDSDAILMVNDGMGMVCVCEPERAENLSKLFKVPYGIVVGMDNLEEKLAARYRVKNAKFSQGTSVPEDEALALFTK